MNVQLLNIIGFIEFKLFLEGTCSISTEVLIEGKIAKERKCFLSIKHFGRVKIFEIARKH